MSVFGKEIHLSTQGFSEILDISERVKVLVGQSGVREGLVSVTCVGSTASVTTIEFEPALVKDFQDLLEDLASKDEPTRHGETWGDDNGFSHLRASLMGPGVTLPVVEGEVLLGAWQQIVLVDHDNRPRDRRIFVRVMGE